MAAGMPSPLDLANGLVTAIRQAGVLPERLNAPLERLLDAGQADLVIEGIVEGIEGGPFLASHHLKDVLRRSGTELPAVFRRLPRIGFSGLVTSNWDDLLEHSFSLPPAQVHTLADSGPLLEALSKNELFLLKLYGDLEQPQTVILTSARYRDTVIGHEVFGQFLRSLFYSRTLLFAGKSLQGIEDFLASVPSRSESPPRHFAAVLDSEPGIDVKSPSLMRRFGIELVSCPARPDGNAIAAFLELLADRVEQVRDRRPAPWAAAAQPVAARLAKVALENIGPFEQLEIELDPGWTLLLGDNGVGKSSLLKAVATAIVGKEAAPFASRLVRGDAKSAAVTLTTSRGDPYRTEIQHSDTSPLVNSIPVRPLEKEGWLVLGFPPLRTVSWERPATHEALGRASAIDVLPLVSGGADPRLDQLKSWLLHLDHNMQSQTTAPSLRERYRRLWAEFFRVVARITPGVKLAPSSVDAINRQVYVKTDDGEVRIEAVSQGMQSLMGWIGILLQRLFEVYGNDEDPLQRYALVLVDEIDAHMHPQWQQTLVGTLKKLFPHAQFIASSHSPLVVSGLAKEEILVFGRDDESKRRVKVERPPSDLKGWRVDQILTSLAFGLDGARDPDTLRDLRRYTELAAEEEIGEPGELQALAAKLQVRLPSEPEREAARKAFDLMQGYARAQLRAMSATERKAVADELRVQIQEGITGSRRPS
jgi:energy-coupling factor transporter ATP-binding protein EcfA2